MLDGDELPELPDFLDPIAKTILRLSRRAGAVDDFIRRLHDWDARMRSPNRRPLKATNRSK